jgi:FtsP/CotA-like multicopper oxidase with cupredoxin domain
MSRLGEHAMEAGGWSRRDFLKAAGIGALGLTVSSEILGSRGIGLLGPTPRAAAATNQLALAATDGYITLPGSAVPLYVFGFIPVSPSMAVAQLTQTYKGHAQHSAPTIDVKQEDDIKITLTNLGLVQRPDLVDSHTIHWHGFDLPSPLNDGVPEVSVAVPIGQQLTYFYRPHRAGTYMYHCHFEDVEHVQMGMTGIVFVRPTQDGTAITVGSKTFTKFAYNDGDGSTGYDRHFAILVDEIEVRQHDADRDIQLFTPTDFDPHYFTMNGRCYPQTVLPNESASLPAALRIATPNQNYGGAVDYSQPNSSLVQVNAGDRVLLRLANLGYQQHSLELPGIAMKVVGQDASLLRNGTVDTSYTTNTIYTGPGEAREVLFTAPSYDPASPGSADGRGSYNVYYFKSRNWRELSNGGAPGSGGMMTEIRVYQNPLPSQTSVNQTYV